MNELQSLTDQLRDEEDILRRGGSESGIDRQRSLGRLTARERIDALLDPTSEPFELGLWAAWKMYPEWGEVPAAGVITAMGRVDDRPVMVIANDATVKAGAFFPQSVKKVLRAQRIARQFRMPLIYLVDSAGVFLPLQDEIFPDQDDFGRIFRNNVILAEEGIPQYAAVMGNCIAGGAYLPALCDKLLMTEGSQMCLAGPSLVKAAIGQNADPEALGGASMHASISGTVDFHEPNDDACLKRLRSLISLLPRLNRSETPPVTAIQPEFSSDDLYQLVSVDGRREYDAHDLIRRLVDAGSLQLYQEDYGPTIVTAYASIGGHPVGVVANQRKRSKNSSHQLQIGGVLYVDSVQKASKFVNDCNRNQLPLVFLQDVQGFMVGIESEQAGIIRHGANLVRAVSKATVPKFTVIVGGSFGAGNYALCGKAYDPWLVLAWPSAKYAVMGSHQAAATLTDLKIRDAKRNGQTISDEQKKSWRQEVEQRYEQQTDIRYAAARGWVDAIIQPHQTRTWLVHALECRVEK